MCTLNMLEEYRLYKNTDMQYHATLSDGGRGLRLNEKHIVHKLIIVYL